jgi:steroid delta-isomerase-like uncharacterized protein
MPLDPGTLIHRWFDEVWNHGREDSVDELFAPDGIAHGLGEAASEVRGPDAFKIFLRNMRTALPDVSVRIDDTIVHDDKAVVRVLLTGTHLGEGLGVPASGLPVAISGIIIIRAAGSQIAEGWNNWDQLGLLQQTGAIPAPHAADRFLAAPG